ARSLRCNANSRLVHHAAIAIHNENCSAPFQRMEKVRSARRACSIHMPGQATQAKRASEVMKQGASTPSTNRKRSRGAAGLLAAGGMVAARTGQASTQACTRIMS